MAATACLIADEMDVMEDDFQAVVDSNEEVDQLAGFAHTYEVWADDVTTGTNLMIAEVVSNVVSLYSSAGVAKNLGKSGTPWTMLYATDATLGSHTATRVFFAGTGGLVSTDAGMTFNASTNTFALGANHIYSQGAHGLTLAADDWAVGSTSGNFVMWDNSGGTLHINNQAMAGTALNVFGTIAGSVMALQCNAPANGDTVMIATSSGTVVNTLYGFKASMSSNTNLYFTCQQNGNGSAVLESLVLGTGDAQSLYSINGGQAWAVGLDNSDSDAFNITAAATLSSTTYAFKIATTGATTILQWSNTGTTTLATAQGDGAWGLTGAAQTWYDQSTATQFWYRATGTQSIKIDGSGTAGTQVFSFERGTDTGAFHSIRNTGNNFGFYLAGGNSYVFNSASAAALLSISNSGIITHTPAVAASGNNQGYIYTGAAHTGQGNSDTPDYQLALSATFTFTGSATLATQRTYLIAATPRTYAANAAMTITDCATMVIGAAPIAGANMTFTRSMALWVGDGWSRHGAGLSIGAITTAPATGVLHCRVGATFGADAAPTAGFECDVVGDLRVSQGLAIGGTVDPTTGYGYAALGWTVGVAQAASARPYGIEIFDSAGALSIKLYTAGTAGGTGATETVFNETADANQDFRVEGGSLAYALFLDASTASENLHLLTTAAANTQSMDRGIFLGDCTTAPTAAPASGIFLYAEAGVLKYVKGDGTVVEL